MAPIEYVLVTGATGFIGAHVVDILLSRGLAVRGATRSVAKGEAMIHARPQHAGKLDFVKILDFEQASSFTEEVVKDIDAIIHIASPLTYDTKDNEKELIIPAVNGIRSILQVASSSPRIQRIVLTSSFAAVVDIARKAPPYFTYTASDWNPLTYAEAADPAASAVVAYRGSKKFAELAAWDFVRDNKPQFDIVALCPPMTFGPVVHPVPDIAALNESNAELWKVACGAGPLPVARVPFWIDVRDLAEAHVQALLRAEVGGRRYVPAAPERFSYALAAKIISEEFDWAKGRALEPQTIDESHGIDGETAAKELGYRYRSFKETVTALVSQVKSMESKGE